MQLFRQLIAGIFTFCAIAPLALIAKERATTSDEKVVATIEDWKKAHKIDQGIVLNIDASLKLMLHADQFIEHPEVDQDLKGRIEKVRDEAFARIDKYEEKAVPYLLLEYARGWKSLDESKKNSKDKKDDNFEWKFRMKAAEDALSRIGLKGIAALTEFHSIATKNKASALAAKSKDLITKIAKQGDLAVEQAKVQMELNRSNRDEADRSRNNTAEVPLPLPETAIPQQDSFPQQNQLKPIEGTQGMPQQRTLSMPGAQN